MNNTNISLSLLLALLLAAATSVAQGYNTAVGLRVGRAGGVSAAQRLGKHASAEAYLTTGIFDDGTTVTLIGRRHVPILLKRFNMFVGAGLHKGWNYVEERDEKPSRRGNPFGFDGQVGAEVTLGRTNIAFDYNVQLNISGSLSPIRPPGAAVTFRYVIDKRESKLRLPWLKEDKAQKKAREKRKKERARRKKKRDKDEDKRGLRERLGIGKG